MRVISQFIAQVSDLIEAEGAALLTVAREEGGRVRTALARLVIGLAALAVAVPVVIGGLGFLTIGLLWLLETHLSRWLAASLTGAALLGVGLALILGFAGTAWRRKS